MNATAPDPASLQNLRDIALPPPVPWWPPAPGWYAVAAVLFVIVAALSIRWFLRYRADRYRREALAELDRIARGVGSPEDRPAALRATAVLVKRVALAAFPRERVAGLSGDAWRGFLEGCVKGEIFTSAMVETMESAMYREARGTRPDEDEMRGIFAAARSWIRSHRVGKAA
jgi:hypothetical protein